MTSHINGLHLRRFMGRDEWLPPEPFGPDGWKMLHRNGDCSVIVTCFDHEDGVDWIHASMTRPGRVPSYDDLCRLHRAVWGETGWAYHLFAPASDHVNIHADALHLWGRRDGKPVLPNFGGVLGSI